jgi:hypothetical protein
VSLAQSSAEATHAPSSLRGVNAITTHNSGECDLGAAHEAFEFLRHGLAGVVDRGVDRGRPALSYNIAGPPRAGLFCRRFRALLTVPAPVTPVSAAMGTFE